MNLLFIDLIALFMLDLKNKNKKRPKTQNKANVDANVG